MPVVPTGEILAAAYRERYGVAAINIVNDLTLEAVLAAATEQRAPLIVQTSVKTVRSIGYDVLYAMWTAMTAGRRRSRSRCTSTTAPTARDHRVPASRAGTRCCSTPPGCRSRRTSGRRSRSSPRPSSTAPRSRARSSPSPASRTASAPTRRPPARTWTTSVRFIETHRGRRVRAGDRQRARRLLPGADAGRAAGLRHRRRGRHPDRPARRHRDDRRAVHRPDRPGLRQDQHLHRRSRSRT